MLYRGNGVMKYHPRSRKAHNLADFFAHFGLIAMYLAVGAKGFAFHKRAFIAALIGIIKQLLTILAQAAFAMVLLAAIERNHP